MRFQPAQLLLLIFHAAAYKHVSIVEQNLIEGICTNVFGTGHAAEAALDSRVETFVLVSNPVNVMGASKRFAELSVFAHHMQDPERYGVVDFAAQGRALGIEEKSAKPQFNYAVIGLYFYDERAYEFVQQLVPSARGELACPEEIGGRVQA